MMSSSSASTFASTSPRLGHHLSSTASTCSLRSDHSTSGTTSPRAPAGYYADLIQRNSPLPQTAAVQATDEPPSAAQSIRPPSPIPIPKPRRDSETRAEPVFGAGHRKRHFFPFRDPSPLRIQGSGRGSFDDNDLNFLSSSTLRLGTSTMHPDRRNLFYTPTSPLSPKMNPSAQQMSPQSARTRPRNSPQSSKSMRLGALPRFHPAVYQSQQQSPEPTSSPRPPTSPLYKSGPTQQRIAVDSPRVMRQYQLELLARADISSRLAASPYTAKPNSPRIDPANSPGPVTPLALEEGDYFMVAGGTSGPAESPGSRSEGSVKDVGDKANTPKASNKKQSPRR